MVSVGLTQQMQDKNLTPHPPLQVLDLHPRRPPQHPSLHDSILVHLRLPSNVNASPPFPHLHSHPNHPQCPFPHPERANRSPPPPLNLTRTPHRRILAKVHLPSPPRLENLHDDANLHGGLLPHLLFRPVPPDDHQEHGLHCQRRTTHVRSTIRLRVFLHYCCELAC